MIKVDGLPYWRLSGFYFLFFLTIGGFMPYWNLYLKSIDMTAAQIGILSAVVVVTKIFASPFWGWLVDHRGNRIKVIQLCSLFTLVFFSLVLFFHEFWALFLILFGFSIFWSAGLPLIEATTLSHLGENTHDYTVVRVWGSISFIIGVLALGQFFDKQPINYLLPILVVSMALVWLHSLSLPEIDGVAAEENPRSFMDTIKHPTVVYLFIVCFLVQVSHGPYYTFFSIYLEEHGYSNSFIGIAWAIGVLAEVFVYLVIHRVIRTWGLRWLMIMSLLMASLRWLLIGVFVDSVAILLFAQLLHAATFGVYHAVAIQYIHREFRGAHQGRGQALYSSISFGAGLALGTLASGYMWESIGSMQTFLFAAAISSVAVIIAVKGLPD
ncbi:MAG: MFS transporter [Gammaproteobacteria bacterium]